MEVDFEEKRNGRQAGQDKDRPILYIKSATLHPYIKMRGCIDRTAMGLQTLPTKAQVSRLRAFDTVDLGQRNSIKLLKAEAAAKPRTFY